MVLEKIVNGATFMTLEQDESPKHETPASKLIGLIGEEIKGLIVKEKRSEESNTYILKVSQRNGIMHIPKSKSIALIEEYHKRKVDLDIMIRLSCKEDYFREIIARAVYTIGKETPYPHIYLR